jgi:erythromycin esterase-like protein
MERKNIVPGMKGSYEALFHELQNDNFILPLSDNDELKKKLKIPLLQRAIGVIYRPETELMSHYFFTILPYHFDRIIHFDTSKALTPLDADSKEQGE